MAVGNSGEVDAQGDIGLWSSGALKCCSVETLGMVSVSIVHNKSRLVSMEHGELPACKRAVLIGDRQGAPPAEMRCWHAAGLITVL